MGHPKTGTVALVVRFQGEDPQLVEQVSDDREIQFLEEVILQKGEVALEELHAFREGVARETEQFGDYVEELITQPFVSPEVLQHGLQWLHSKIRIEEFRRQEEEATRVIAQHAFQIFEKNRGMNEFLLAGPSAQVRIRVFTARAPAASSDRPDPAADAGGEASSRGGARGAA